MMSKTLIVLAAASLLAPNVYAVELSDEFALDATFSVLSQYRTRGISQTQNDPAAQFDGMLSSKTTGLYLGIWTSNVNYGGGSNVRQELDYYAGWFLPFTQDIDMDVGYIKYTYARGNEANFSETYGILTAYGFKVAAQYSENALSFDKGQSTMYTWVGYEHDIPYGLKLATRYGKMDFKDPVFFSADGSARDLYHEWEVKLSRIYSGLNWALSYVDTDLSKHECYGTIGFGDACTATLVASVSKKF
ncbi:TorF family putative porin [Pseudomonas gingeri]